MIFHKFEFDRVITYVTKLFERGRSIKIEPVKRKRTLEQNSYFWLIMTHVSKESDNSKDDLYQLCLSKFPMFKSIEFNGVVYLIPVTLSGMDKDQNRVFIDNVATYFRQEGYDIPDPEDKKAQDMYDEYNEKGLI